MDRKSSPGLFMAALWSLSFIVMLIFYRDIKSVESSKTNKKEETTEFLNEEVTKNSIETKLTLKEKQHEFFRFEIRKLFWQKCFHKKISHLWLFFGIAA